MPRPVAVLLVVLASAAGGLVALWSFSGERRLASAGTIELSVEPFHDGALDLYVPVFDWGIRFPGVRAPARLHVEVRTVNRRAAAALATGGTVPVRDLRAQSRDAIASYLRALAGVTFGAALLAGALAAVALRRRWQLVTALVVALGWAAVIAFLLAPRGALNRPEYYAHGGDIPVALRALEAASTSSSVLSEELDSQLVGLARLVSAPAGRVSLKGVPRLVIASDLHNNVISLPTLAGAAAGGPVLFPGDLTDRGSPLETAVTKRVVATGHPFVFVSGNHDSDTLERQLAEAGAIVLGADGQLRADGTRGPVVVSVAGLRVAGYGDPNERQSSDGYKDRGASVTPAQQEAFAAWLTPLVGNVDVVMVHEPDLAKLAVQRLRADPPEQALLLAVAHTHKQAVDASDGVIEVDGGTVGAGGTGNLSEGNDVGLAVLSFTRSPFAPLAADLVVVDPGTGAARAQRVRLDAGIASVGEPLS